MTQPSNPVFVGVDDGHHTIKIATENGRLFRIPSRVTQGRKLIVIDQESPNSFFQTDDGLDYTVSENLETYIDTKTPDYPTSNANRVLVHAALRRAGFGGQEIHIATGLPVSYYYIGDMVNSRLINAKRNSLMKTVTSSGKPLAKILSNRVTTEAIAAYFDQLMDLNGRCSEDFQVLTQAAAGVIDIGGRTTDCAVIFPGGQEVDVSRSGSSNVGMLQLEERVRNFLHMQCDLDTVSPILVSQAIEAGKVVVANEEFDLRAQIHDYKRNLWAEICNAILSRIGNARDLTRLYIVGGGSLVLKDFILERFPHATFPENPAFANARGMLKIIKHFRKGHQQEP